MPLLTLLMEFVVLHTIVEKLYYRPEYEVMREDLEILPVYDNANEYRPLSIERLFMIQQMLK